MTPNQKLEKAVYKECVEWDIPTWKHAFDYWNNFLKKNPPKPGSKGLEVGARHGGLSLFMAALHGVDMVCSDYHGPSELAPQKHREYGVADKVTYADVSALELPYTDNTFDYVLFKSVLGAVAVTKEGSKKELQQQAMNEFHRVLKPGGVLLFAENLKSSPLHQFLRKKFMRWGWKWRYVTVPEMKEFTSSFGRLEYDTFGFLNTFIRNEKLKALALPIERLLHAVLPESANYIIYGVVIKKK